ncbi:hypothetical protein F5Y16DRAFT_154124 [Xylariaceae sp. FL0255]|nr:hypothetical protein F5Y16DRAFT_154124 [Xylariaceae sp. FL0255]
MQGRPNSVPCGSDTHVRISMSRYGSNFAFLFFCPSHRYFQLNTNYILLNSFLFGYLCGTSQTTSCITMLLSRYPAAHSLSYAFRAATHRLVRSTLPRWSTNPDPPRRPAPSSSFHTTSTTRLPINHDEHNKSTARGRIAPQEEKSQKKSTQFFGSNFQLKGDYQSYSAAREREREHKQLPSKMYAQEITRMTTGKAGIREPRFSRQPYTSQEPMSYKNSETAKRDGRETEKDGWGTWIPIPLCDCMDPC